MKIMQLIQARSVSPFLSEPITIACVGDSVTHGCFEMFVNTQGFVTTHFAPSLSYVQLLQDDLNLYYPIAAINVLNCGISGDNIRLCRDRYARDVARYDPDLVVFCYGLNDCQIEGYSPDAFQADVAGMLSTAVESGAECILLTPNMMSTYLDPTILDDTVREMAALATARQGDGSLGVFVEASREAARELGVPIADAYAVWEALYNGGADVNQLLANRVNHPLPAMHRIFAQKIMECMLMA